MTEYKKVFVDTAPLIYLLERNSAYYDRLEKLFGKWYKAQTIVVTSAITVEEYCVFPYKHNRLELISKFDNFIEDYGLRIYSIEAGIAKKASWIRSQYPGFKAMDALQLAVAEAYYCDCFLTNDKQLRQYAGLNCVVVDDITNT
jgi:predicted nucleic acid-binding protein